MKALADRNPEGCSTNGKLNKVEQLLIMQAVEHDLSDNKIVYNWSTDEIAVGKKLRQKQQQPTRGTVGRTPYGDQNDPAAQE